MQSPLTRLFALQLAVVDQWLALTREVVGFYLSLQPKLEPVKISRSTSLVPLGRISAHQGR